LIDIKSTKHTVCASFITLQNVPKTKNIDCETADQSIC